MIKHILFILCLVSLPLYAQVGGGVQIDIDAPVNVVAGNTFEVTATLVKGDLKDYSRFSQDLPAGFAASNISSPNAVFTFDKERVRIIWLKLPSTEEIEVKYEIKVHQRLSGTLELGGTFAYVENGARKFIEVTNKKQVQVLPSPDIDQSLVVDISEFKNIVKTGQPTIQSDFASVIRQEPAVAPNGIVTVTLLVHKPEGTRYLKLEETIPGGYSFEALQSNKAIVSQAASIAKFVWMKPPAESLFVLKYRLVPILEQEQQAILIQGTLTYTDGDQNMVEEIEELGVSLEALTSAQQLELMKTGVVPDVVASVKTTTVGKNKNKSVVYVPVLTSLDGIYFRVQVAALKDPSNAKVYFSEFDLLKDVRVEQIEGWYKYTVGPVTNFNEAEQLRKKLNRQTPVKNTFVVAYKNGNRISITAARKAL